MDKNKKMHPIARYFFNQAMALDQLINAMGGGDPDESVSSRVGKIERHYVGEIPWYRPLPKFLCWGLDKIDRNHCQEAIEEDEGKHAVLDRY